jgi:hypothetical protein
MRAEEGDKRKRYLYRKTVKGNDYVYFRTPNGKLIRLPDDERSPEFKRSYDACLKAITKNVELPAPPHRRPAETKRIAFVGGTVGQAIQRYQASPEFDGLKASSKEKYRIALDIMRDMIGDAKLADFDVDAVDI